VGNLGRQPEGWLYSVYTNSETGRAGDQSPLHHEIKSKMPKKVTLGIRRSVFISRSFPVSP